MQWFRLYDDVLDDPKAQQLSPILFKHWINLLCLANKGTERGVLPSTADIAFRLRLTVAKTESVIAELSALGLLDRHENGLTPHNWGDRQKRSDDVTARTWKHKQERSRERSEEQVATVLDTDTDTDTDTEVTGINPVRARAPKKPTKPVARTCRLPDAWSPSRAVILVAQELHFDEPAMTAELAKFASHFRANGKTMVDWDQAAMNWLRRTLEFPRGSPSAPSRNGQPKGPDFAARAFERRRLEETGT